MRCVTNIHNSEDRETCRFHKIQKRFKQGLIFNIITKYMFYLGFLFVIFVSFSLVVFFSGGGGEVNFHKKTNAYINKISLLCIMFIYYRKFIIHI